MNNPIDSIKIIRVLFLVLAIFTCNQAFSVFIISGESNCSGSDIYAYHFSETSLLPDYTIKVSETAFLPDITMKLVDDPKQADLILIDGFQKSSMKVCKKSTSFGEKIIKVSETTLLPDITVKLSESAFLPDYKIFVLSEFFTKEEVAALFAVILQTNKEN